MTQFEAQQVLIEMGRSLIVDNKQNNHCTADPIFTVEHKHRYYGIDTNYTEQIAWINEEGIEESDPIEIAKLEALFDEVEKTSGYTRTGYYDVWEFHDAFVTIEAAKEYVENKIKRGETDKYRVYVQSGCRNPEWKLLRAALICLAQGAGK